MPNKNYVLFILTLLLLFNYIDRLALGIVLQDIKLELGLTDTQLGFMTGFAFAVFYSIMGIPIARWADRGNRVVIISVTAMLWSVAVAMCAIATSFEQLLLIRVAVAVGEAGCIPPAFSLIADYFGRAERPRAAAIYGLGAPLSFIFGFFAAGWLNELYGWRATFVLLAAPGLLIAVAAALTLKEPRRLSTEASAIAKPPTISLLATFRHLMAIATFRYLLFCLSVMAFFNYGILQWLPTFYIRVFGLTARETGAWLALTFGGLGLLGSFLSGEVATRFAPNNEALQLKVLSFFIGAIGIVLIGAYLAPTAALSFVFVALYAFGVHTLNGPLYATLQSLVPDALRATAFAMIFMMANLIGMGLGPLLVGVLSDAFAPSYGDLSLRPALLCIAPGFLIGAWLVWRAHRSVDADFAQIERVATL